jgi:Threonine dehydrogenase and related Zn-dependent dehydrogenases
MVYTSEKMVNEKMQTAVFMAPQKIELKELEKPIPKNDEVLIKVKACGICTADRRLYSGTKKMGYPLIGGHETSGMVEEISGECSRTELEPGDHVALDLIDRCGKCYYCRRGYENQCLKRLGRRVGEIPLRAGGFAEYIAVPSKEVFKISDKISFEEAALTEPVSCVIHSVHKTHIRSGDTIAIIGAGPMGILHLLIAKKLGSIAIVSDIDEKRREFAKKLGADFVFNPLESNVITFVKEHTNGRGADVVFVTACNKETASQSIEMAGKVATVIFYGASYPPTTISIDPNRLHYDEIILTGSSNRTSKDFSESVTLLNSEHISVKPLISKVLPLKDIEKGFKLESKGSIQRVVVTL